MVASNPPPYLLGIRLVAERVAAFDEYPFCVPCIQSLDLVLRSNVTFLIGDNGSGKSTLLEGIAAACQLPLSGGGRSDLASKHGPRNKSPLASALRPSFAQRPPDAFFFRGEFSAHFASLLDQRRDDPDFLGNPYANYGGRSLHARSHGESFLTLMNERIGTRGLYLLDEPEAALSPQRQLALLALVADRVASGKPQFILATHSPILMTIPNAEILLMGDGRISSVALEDTEHYQVTKSILENPQSFWRHLDS